MAIKKKILWIIGLIILLFAIKLFSANKAWIEGLYSTGIYTSISKVLRFLLGWLPFSVGDIFYLLLGIWLLVKLLRGVKKICTRKKTWRGFGTSIVNSILFLLSLYVFFCLIWGINYNRLGVAHQLKLEKEKHTKQDLIDVTNVLIEKINNAKLELLLSKQSYPNNKELVNRINEAYKRVSNEFVFVQYSPKSIKASMWGWLGNYAGFTGYYNPFSGEAQVNTTVPKFIQPFTTLHEVAHQLGYAKENEANFVGFLVGSNCADTLLRYSTYLEMYVYCNRNLFFIDSSVAKANKTKLISFVKDDLLEWRNFANKHTSFLEPIVRVGYNFYLKNHNQPQGILTYDEVTEFLLAYYKKYGKI